jgi:hypothetical protein
MTTLGRAMLGFARKKEDAMNGSEKWIQSCSVLAVLWAATGCCPSALKPSPKAPPGSVNVGQVIAEVQDAIEPFWESNGGLPPLSAVEIDLQTVRDDKISAEADFLVVALQGYYDNAVTQEVDIKLAKPPKGTRAAATTLKHPSISEVLRNEIAEIQKVVKASYGTGEHLLRTKEIDVQLKFAVTWDVQAGVSGWKILPITFSASNEYSRSTSNTIIVTFAQPDH